MCKGAKSIFVHAVHVLVYPRITCSSVLNVKGDNVLQQYKAALHKQKLTKVSLYFCLSSTHFRS